MRSKDCQLYEQLADLCNQAVSPSLQIICCISNLSVISFYALFRYSTRNLSSPIKATLHFSLSRSGILSFDRADAVIEISEWVDVPRKNVSVENSTIASSNATVEDSANTSEGKNDTSTPENDGVVSSSNPSTEEQGTPELATEKKLKKRTFRIPLKVSAVAMVL